MPTKSDLEQLANATGVARLVGHRTHESVELVNWVEGDAGVVIDGGADERKVSVAGVPRPPAASPGRPPSSPI